MLLLFQCERNKFFRAEIIILTLLLHTFVVSKKKACYEYYCSILYCIYYVIFLFVFIKDFLKQASTDYLYMNIVGYNFEVSHRRHVCNC